MVYLTIKYGILGLSISFFFSLSFNNLSQLALLYYLEKLNPITKYHLLTLLSSTIIVLISYYTKNMLGVFYSIIVFSILLSIFSISAYKHFFNAKEKQSFKNAISKFKST